MTTLNLFIDWINQVMLKNTTSASVFVPRPFFQNNVVPFQIQIVQPDPAGGSNDFIFPDISNMSLALAIADVYGGTTLAAQLTWTKDTGQHIFTANLALNTAAMTTFMTGATSGKTAYMEIKVTEGTASYTIWEGQVTINPVVISVATVQPIPGFTTLTLEDAVQRFPQFKMQPGQQLTFVSPDGTQGRIEGVKNDGTPESDYVANP